LNVLLARLLIVQLRQTSFLVPEWDSPERAAYVYMFNDSATSWRMISSKSVLLALLFDLMAGLLFGPCDF
jgi:hypothetical protein